MAWSADLDSLRATSSELLLALRGQAIRTAHVVLYEPWKMIHAATPVVLEFENGVHLEAWTIYVSDFTVTWNSIDMAKPPFYWIDKPDSESRWIEGGNPVLSDVLPNRVVDIAFLAGDNALTQCGGIHLSFADGAQLIVANYADDVFIGSRIPKGMVRVPIRG